MSSEQQQETKKKTKKSYAQLLKEAEETNKKVAAIYVRQLCEALRDENPEMSYAEIREKVFADCSAIGWGGKTGSTIYHNFPSWLIEDDPHHQRQVKAWETRHANQLNSIADSAIKVQQDVKNIPLPPEPKEKKEELDEEFFSTLQELGVAPYGETGKSTRELTGAISEHAYKLFAALTNNDSPPNTSSDLLVDYIRPSREFRRGLMLEVGAARRAAIHNALHYVSVALEDMIEIISEVERKEEK